MHVKLLPAYTSFSLFPLFIICQWVTDYGQLGIDAPEPRLQPGLVASPLTDALITTVACGYYHTGKSRSGNREEWESVVMCVLLSSFPFVLFVHQCAWEPGVMFGHGVEMIMASWD